MRTMKLPEILQDKKNKILSVWIDKTLDSYISPGFFKKSRDTIANPVGSNIRDGLTTVFELLVQGEALEKIVPSLEKIIRIRAVQEFTPSQAVAPFLELKWVIRQILSEDAKTRALMQDMDSIDCEIERIALAAFDIYVNCREDIYKVRMKEVKSGNSISTDGMCLSAHFRKKQDSGQKIN